MLLQPARRSPGCPVSGPSRAFLLGLLIYGNNDDEWLQDNEEYLQARFYRWFVRLSTAWKGVLSVSDEVLGLPQVGGRVGGYRAPLLSLLEKWESVTNHTLAEVYDEHAEEFGLQGTRVRICAEVQSRSVVAGVPLETDEVIVTGLVSEAGQALNGRRGTVIGIDNKSGRLMVSFDPNDSSQSKKLKRENVRFVKKGDP